ncbi:MAG: hypothetical protein ACKODK_09050 [Opitutaceae bacterium]
MPSSSIPAHSSAPSFAVKVVQGRVSLHKTTGPYVRTVCTGAASAVLQGGEVHVSNPDGKVRIFGVNGIYKRTL